MSACRSCTAPIIWRNHTRTGRPAPIDAQPNARGNIWIDDTEYGLCSLISGGTPCQLHRAHYTNHFQTCPNARIHHKATR